MHIYVCTRRAAKLAATPGLPSFNLNDGSSGYIHATETLASKHADQVLACEVENFFDTQDVEAAVMGLVMASLESFAAGLATGIMDFYLLHNFTGARAVWAVLNGVKSWGSREATLRVQQTTLRALWTAILFTHASRNSPKINADPKDRIYPQTCRAWTEITAWALASVSMDAGVGPNSASSFHKSILSIMLQPPTPTPHHIHNIFPPFLTSPEISLHLNPVRRKTRTSLKW